MIRKIPEYKKKSKIFKNKLYVLIRVSVSNSKLLYFFTLNICYDFYGMIFTLDVACL
jgi:hypothetical protein